MPGYLICPEIEMTFVPVEDCVPISANFAPPIPRMIGTFISVSTLLISVGPW